MSATTLSNPSSQANTTMQNRQVQVWRYVVIAIGIVATILIALYLYLGIQFWNRPFIGALLTRTLTVNEGTPQGSAEWAGLEAGLQAQDLITQIGDEELFQTDSFTDYRQARAAYETVLSALPRNDAGEFEAITIGFIRDTKFGDIDVSYCEAVSTTRAACALTIVPGNFPDVDFMSYFVLPFGTSILVALLGWAIVYSRSNRRTSHLAAAIAFLTVIYTAGIFDVGTQAVGGVIWHFSAATTGGVLIVFGLTFPRRLQLVRTLPFAEFGIILVAALVGLALAYLHFNPADAWSGGVATQGATLTMGIGLVGLLVLSIIQRQRATSPTIRDQSNTIFIGSILLLVPLIFWIVSRVLITQWEATLPVNLEALLPLLIFPNAGITYAVLQYRQFDTDRAISHGITYTIMGGALLIAIFLLTLGGTLLAIELLNATNILLISLILFVMVIFFTPVRNHLQERIDAIYFRTRRNLQNQVESFAQSLTTLNSYEDITREFYSVLRNTIAPSRTFIFLQESGDGDYVVYRTQGIETDIRFSPTSPFIELLRESEEPLDLQVGQQWPQKLWADQARLKLLRAALIIGIKNVEQVVGFIILAPPHVARTYTHDEVRFLNNLVAQFTIATERSRVIESLEKRVQELDVLSQVGQAVNFTIEFDDLLELIYAQTSKLVPVPTFYIALYDERIKQLYFAFFLEGDDRFEDKEHVRWNIGNDLFSEVIKTNSSIRVANYKQETTDRGASSELVTDQLRAWMGVPLTAGRRTLGVMAIGKTRDTAEYTAEQFKIFNDIGALAATSLDKANLFMQTRMRERQLTVLNDISRQLVATESDVEKLLEIIMNSAVEILNAEAGSLLLTTQDDTGDLEFRVVIGGGGEDLIGTRIAAGQGVVGQVVSTGEPIIVNDAAQDERHNVEVVEDFISRSLLAVPLIAQEQVIGVLEVLNKKDKTPFVDEEAELLTTFSGQAAIAIENARLFQMTDQQLAQRVRELETLERLDAELNRTLDLNDVAAITVKSAMNILGANAGALGIVNQDPPFLRVVAIEGYAQDEYPEDAEGDDNLIWPLDHGIIGRVFRSRQADIVMDVETDPDYDIGLHDSNSQITLPMMTGNEVNAILILEKNTLPRFSLPDWAFAQRVTEHASIAIANAQFYDALSLANKSKSEFMGFAAHELKTPLTSVKGYSSALLSGMTAELPDNVQTFLQVINSNANRMQTIIDDLRDAAKVDAGEFSVNPQPMNIRNAVVETLRPFVQTLEEKNQTLVNEVPEDLPLIMGDETRVVQVITNLITNAHKYSHAETTITIAAKIYEAYTNRKGKNLGKMVVLWVKDQGFGISEEDQKKMFRERYFRSTNEEALEQPGTGLGMTLTYNIMQQHGGEIWIESQLGEGSTFYISFPIATENQIKATQGNQEKEAASD